MTRFASTILAALLCASAAQAQTSDAHCPELPIRFIVQFTAGRSSDTVALALKRVASEPLDRSEIE
jgi:tripartite-type tricarboxylate transporter receptor subunit TctC